jgi:NADH:ubiquinone oxidoreductase subunit 6 (subunit J)
MHLILFLFFGGICVAGAVNLLVQRHPINSALSLVVVMASLAGEYLLLGAEFVAAIQVIVYAGAIMVLFIFTIMLLNSACSSRGCCCATPTRAMWRSSRCPAFRMTSPSFCFTTSCCPLK